MLQKDIALYLPEPARTHLWNEKKAVLEIHLRTNRPIHLVFHSAEDCFIGEAVSAEQLRKIALEMMDHSYHTHEDELAKGFFTMTNGCRVGVGGSFSTTDGKIHHLKNIGSLCVRIARDMIGCAEEIAKEIVKDELLNTLFLSAPGMGKTTLLRDLARILSDAGYKVGIADERHEIAACVNGNPGFDVGKRSDIIDGCPKAKAIEMLIRCLSPQIIITDEIGTKEDLLALREASRMGVCVIASAHAGSFDELESSRLGVLFRERLFRCAVLLGGQPGVIQEIRYYGRGENR